MDMNGHVNNTVFLGMALEAVPKDMYDNYILLQVRLLPLELLLPHLRECSRRLQDRFRV